MRILLVEDDKELCDAIKLQLERAGYETDCCGQGQEAFYYAAEYPYDVIILDRMLPHMDGLSVLGGLRRMNITTPVIITTALDGINDRIDGLDAGADDYLVKPFLPLELVTRVKALFRRVDAFSGQEEENSENLELGDIVLFPGRRTASLKGEEFALTPLEFDFLRHMLEHPEHAASRDDLLKALWKVDSKEVDTRAVDDMVKRLRKKMKEQNSAVKIETVWGYGFRLTAGGDE
mgnify:CR=1 FL=1